MKKLFNRFLSHLEYKLGKFHLKSFPPEVNIEITSYCNLSCPMCGRVSKNTPSAYMDISHFKKIIDQIKDYTELVFLSAGVGEPITHPKISEMLAYCRKSKVKTLVSSNATLFSEKKINQILENPPDQLILSLDGVTKETHESIRIGSNFEKTMNYVSKLCSEKVKRKLKKPFIICQMIFMPQNQNEALDFYEKWKSVPGVNAVRVKRMNLVKGSDMEDEQLKVVNISRLKKKLSKRQSCFYPWRQLVISAKNNVGLCCRDHNFSFDAGSLESNSIKDLWNSEQLIRARKLLASGKGDMLPECNGCDGINTNLLTGTAVSLVNAHQLHKLAPEIESKVIRHKLKNLW